jgi:ParB family chromosome partitioning protein
MTMIDVLDDTNGRAALDPAHVHELATQIGRDGLLHPITLRPTAERFTLIAGRHRLEAFRELGYTHAPAVIKHVTDYTAGILRMSENVCRANLSPAEEAMQLAALLNETPGGVEELAARTGRTVNWCLDRLDMCDWPESLMQHIHNGKISLAAAKSLARIPDPELREIRINDAARSGINARTASLWLQQAVGDVQAPVETSEKWSQEAIPKFRNETFSNCVCCRTEQPLERTRSVRVCEGCLRELERVKQENNPHVLEGD